MPEFRGGVWELVRGTPVYPDIPSESHIVYDFKMRLSKPVTQTFPTGFYVVNAWKTDGSEIGRYIEYHKTNVGTQDNIIRGQITVTEGLEPGFSYNFPSNFFPVVQSPCYPTPILNANNGIRYQPITFGLPSALEFPTAAKAFGLADEVYFTIVDVDNIMRRLTITGIDFAPDQYFLYLEESNIGDGSAYRQNIGTAQRPRYFYAWRLSYNAVWKFYNASASQNYLTGTAGFSIGRSVPAGNYKLSDLIGQGATIIQGNGGFYGQSPSYTV